MFLDQCRPATESPAEDENFYALEIVVLEDLATLVNRKRDLSITGDHIRYAQALNKRGEHASALEVINHLLAAPGGTSSASADLLSHKADALLALGREDDAASALNNAESLAATPESREGIAIKRAKLLTSQGKSREALFVLQSAIDSLEVPARSGEIVTTLAAAYIEAGDEERAEQLLRDHIHPLHESDTPRFSVRESLVCRIFLASVLLDRGRYSEADGLLSQVRHTTFPATHILRGFASYYLGVSLAARTGALLTDAFSMSASGAPHLGLPNPFASAYASQEDFAADNYSSEPSIDPYLHVLLRCDEIERQGVAYALLTSGDNEAAIDAFNGLEKMRKDAGRPNGLSAAVDSKGLATALKRAGRPEALNQARVTRRQLQILLGLSELGTQQAVLDEAHLLLARGGSDEASLLATSCLQHVVDTDPGREMCLRLRLILMEVATRKGRAAESLALAPSLELEAQSLSNRNVVEPMIQYQKAAAAAAMGDFDIAEHEFESLRRDLETTYGYRNELSLKATYRLARVLQRRGEYEQSVSQLLTLLGEDCIDIDPQLPIRAGQRIAECLLAVDDPAGAANYYRMCADTLSKSVDGKDPSYLHARLGQADCLLICGRYREARVVYRGIWEVLHNGRTGLDRFYIRATIGSATCLRRMNDYSGAAFNYRRALEVNSHVGCLKDPETIQLEKWLAWTLEMTGELEEATRHYKTAIQHLQDLDPDSAEITELRFRMACCSR